MHKLLEDFKKKVAEVEEIVKAIGASVDGFIYLIKSSESTVAVVKCNSALGAEFILTEIYPDQLFSLVYTDNPEFSIPGHEVKFTRKDILEKMIETAEEENLSIDPIEIMVSEMK